MEQFILVRREFRRALVEMPCFDQFVAELAAGFDQKRPGTHRRVANFEGKNLIGFRLRAELFEDRLQGRADNRFGE